MANELALRVYQAFQDHLKRNDFKFDIHEEDLVISLDVHGDDLPLRTIIRVMEKRDLVQVLCYCPDVPEDKRLEMATAICVANYGIVNGSFDFDISDGEVRFRVTHNYSSGVPDDDLIAYLLGIAFHTTDKYNDMFFMLGKGLISLEQFIEKENEN